MNIASQVASIHLADPAERPALARELIASVAPGEVPDVTAALAITQLAEDELGWDASSEFIGRLPSEIVHHPSIRERALLASAKQGNNLEAAHGLEALIRDHGPTSERWGMVGGRYKELWRQETDSRTAVGYLHQAIDAYERGVAADPNDYYPSSNLPNLYRSLPQPADIAALFAVRIAAAACHRAIETETGDEWANPTLLGLAFASADAATARELASQVVSDGPASWKLNSTMADLTTTVELLDPEARDQLAPILADVRDLLGGSTERL